MKNILYYLKKYRDTPFTEKPFNEVDGLILCQLSYLNLDDYIPSIKEEKNFVSLTDIITEESIHDLTKETFDERKNIKLLRLLDNSTRYQGLYVNYFENRFYIEEVEQYCSMCFKFTDFYYIVFRGTDTSLLGWKEDFNMVLYEAIPSQQSAEAYLNTVSKLLDKPYYIGGHSKGGNLALYAAMYGKISAKQGILKIYNYDGPGFNHDISHTKEFLEIKDLIVKMTCEKARIGILMYNSEEMLFVKAKGVLLLQHDPYYWKVTKQGNFKYVKNSTIFSRVFEKTVRDFLESTTIIERKRFVELLFVITMEKNHSTVIDIKRNPVKYLRGIKARYKALPPRRKIFIKLMLKRYNQIWKQNFKFYFSYKRKIN